MYAKFHHSFMLKFSVGVLVFHRMATNYNKINNLYLMKIWPEM